MPSFIPFEARRTAAAPELPTVAETGPVRPARGKACSHRPYRAGLGIEAALAEIEKNSGKFYDPQVVAACLRLFREKGYALPS